MRAVVKSAPREGAIDVLEVERPLAGPGQVLIEVAAASICGSDLHIWHWEPAYESVMQTPTILGHEFAGRVAELGAGVSGLAPGDRVVSESILTCGLCRRCRSGRQSICAKPTGLGLHRAGGMADFALTEASLIHRLPESIPFEQGALIEPLAVATHAVIERSGIAAGDLALVVGPGPIGLLVAQVVRAAGGRAVVVGTEADQAVRLQAAKALGFGTINVEREAVAAGLQRLAGRLEADLSFECAGSGAALRTALDGVVKGGTAVLIAIYNGLVQADLALAVRRELSLQTSYASNWLDYERAISFLERGTVVVGPLVQTYPLSAADRAFKDALERQVLKPVLLPGR